MRTLLLLVSVFSLSAFAHTGRFPLLNGEEETIAVSCEDWMDKSLIQIDFAKSVYYSRKHVPSVSFLSLLENLASQNMEAIKRASAQIAGLEKGFRVGPQRPYHWLPEGIQSVVDQELWGQFRHRYPTPNNSARITFFKNGEELQSALKYFERLWSENSDELIVYKPPGANGIATFNFSKEGTLYTISICMKASQSCDTPGFVKTIHPICGPEVMSLRLDRFRRMASEIHGRVRASTEQSYSPEQMGFKLELCR